MAGLVGMGLLVWWGVTWVRRREDKFVHAYLTARYGCLPPELNITRPPSGLSEPPIWARFVDPQTGRRKLLEFGHLALGSPFRLLSEKDL
jgi:hypothetical protein